MDAKLLRLLIDRATEQREEAALRVAQARKDHEAAARTLGTLTDYREQSLERGPVRSQVATDTRQLSIAGQFDARLVAAIEQQTGQTQARAQQVEVRQTEAAQAYQRLKALETIAQRREQRAQKVMARREQRMIDAFATDQAARRRKEDS